MPSNKSQRQRTDHPRNVQPHSLPFRARVLFLRLNAWILFLRHLSRNEQERPSREQQGHSRPPFQARPGFTTTTTAMAEFSYSAEDEITCNGAYWSSKGEGDECLADFGAGPPVA